MKAHSSPLSANPDSYWIGSAGRVPCSRESLQLSPKLRSFLDTPPIGPVLIPSPLIGSF